MSAQVTHPSVKNVADHLEYFSQSARALTRGQAISAKELHAGALGCATLFAVHREALIQNANTLPPELQRNVILQASMEAFSPTLLALRAFSSIFSDVPLEGTDKVEVPYYELDSAASTDFNPAVGYTFGNSSTTFREVEIDKRKYKGLAFTSEEVRRQPFLNQVKLAKLAASKLARDVFADVLSLVTLANYGAAGLNMPASAFDADDVIDIRTAANKRHWPDVGRSLIINSDYDGWLMKDPAVKSAMAFGGSEPIRQGKVPVISGFDYYRTDAIPENGENLRGMAVLSPAILVATSPIMPGRGVRARLVAYDLVIDPQLGIAFEYRFWGEAQSDIDCEIIECNYGFEKGNADALMRITGAAI